MNLVLDASVAIKVFIDEEGAEAARSLVASGARFIAPSLVVAETANVLVKRLRRGELAPTYAAGVLVRLASLFDELAPLRRCTSAPSRSPPTISCQLTMRSMWRSRRSASGRSPPPISAWRVAWPNRAWGSTSGRLDRACWVVLAAR